MNLTPMAEGWPESQMREATQKELFDTYYFNQCVCKIIPMKTAYSCFLARFPKFTIHAHRYSKEMQ